MEMKVLAKDFFWIKHSVWVGESRVENAALKSRCCLDVKKELAQYEKIIQYKINSQSLEDAKLDHLDHFGVGARDTYASKNCLDMKKICRI